VTPDLRGQLQHTLGNSYTLERELGGGGMSRVFVAEENALGRKVVVKVLPPDLAAGMSVERFNREILVAARLRHAHIVPVLAAGETNGLPYYTMQFVEGESLRARLSRTNGIPIIETIGILRDVSKALTFAHEHGVVHRDIKPDDVLIAGGSAVVTGRTLIPNYSRRWPTSAADCSG
jgi:serine/threonine protein kinase